MRAHRSIASSPHRAVLVFLALIALIAGGTREAAAQSWWRAVLDLAGGPLRFTLRLEPSLGAGRGAVCNGPDCDEFSALRARGDTVVLELADFDAAITAVRRGDSLIGAYQNVGRRGPRVIPFRAAPGPWPVAPASPRLEGSWDATFFTDGRASPRVFRFRNGETGVEAAYLSNSGDYGQFWGSATPEDSLDVGRFDGTFVYRITGRLTGDTLRGVFHAGLQTQTPFIAVRSTGKPHLAAPLELTRADTATPFRFAFPDLDGRRVTQDDPRFRGKVVLVDIFGSWCTTCHDAAPTLVRLYREYRDRGLELVGLAYEVTGDSAIDNRLVRRFREKFGIPWPLLLAGINQTEATAATLPQLQGFTAYPTTLFLGRDGRIRKVHAGFIGPAAGELHERQVAAYRRIIEDLLAERR
jgi:thiol-disulfide isomerase/thioredoxin